MRPSAAKSWRLSSLDRQRPDIGVTAEASGRTHVTLGEIEHRRDRRVPDPMRARLDRCIQRDPFLSRLRRPRSRVNIECSLFRRQPMDACVSTGARENRETALADHVRAGVREADAAEVRPRRSGELFAAQVLTVAVVTVSVRDSPFAAMRSSIQFARRSDT